MAPGQVNAKRRGKKGAIKSGVCHKNDFPGEARIFAVPSPLGDFSRINAKVINVSESRAQLSKRQKVTPLPDTARWVLRWVYTV
jgi:hypothetical protein